MSQATAIYERNQEATIYVGNLDQRVHEELLWELFIQVGPVVNVHIPRDKNNNEHQGFGFVEFRGEEDADYAIKIMHMIKLYGKPIKVNKASQEKKNQDIGANVFIGNLDDEVDEKSLYETFNSFGTIVSVKISRDNMTGSSHKYGFISFDNFENSDNAIQAMNGQFLCNRPLTVTYAFKRDSKSEKHGNMAERTLAASRPYTQAAGTPTNIPPPPVPKKPPPVPLPIK